MISRPCPSPSARLCLPGGLCLAWSTWDLSPSSLCLFFPEYSTSLVYFRSLGSAQSYSSHRESYSGKQQRKNHRSLMEPSLWSWCQDGRGKTSLMKNTNPRSELSPAFRETEPVNSHNTCLLLPSHLKDHGIGQTTPLVVLNQTALQPGASWDMDSKAPLLCVNNYLFLGNEELK